MKRWTKDRMLRFLESTLRDEELYYIKLADESDECIIIERVP